MTHDAARAGEVFPRTALHGVERSAVELQNTIGKASVAVRAADIYALALALDQLLDSVRQQIRQHLGERGWAPRPATTQ